MKRVVIDRLWTVCALDQLGQPLGGPVPATVPGSVYADLIAAGLVVDPLLDRNEAAAAWVGHTRWRYETRLFLEPVEPGERVHLIFDGIDTAATVKLDDVAVLSVENMHRSYRVDITPYVVGEHRLTVDIESPWEIAEAHRDRLGALPGAYDTPYNFLRTMACSFGWDWGPALPGAALWRPVHIERWATARLAGVRPQVRVLPSGAGDVVVSFEIEHATRDVSNDLRDGSASASDVSASASDVSPGFCDVSAVVVRPDGREVRAEARVEVPAYVADDAAPGIERGGEVRLRVEDVDLWWPHTLGKPTLHDLTLTLSADGVILDSWQREVGFRTVALQTTPDPFGSAFTFVVNGQPIFAKGVNWIPDTPFPGRLTAQRYADQVAEAVELGADLLRVWGGGIYESEDFYAACDRLGVMVWQDFAFACAAYPEEEPFATEVAAEATEAVSRLMPHPSLVLWCGNNENLWGHAAWGWAEATEGRTWGDGFYLHTLPEIVGRIDSTRPYWPGSPASAATASALHPNDPNHGCAHEWEVWNRRDMEHYRDQVPRFVSEFGWQAPATWSTLRSALSDEPLTATSPGIGAHQKALDGDLKLDRGLQRHTGEATDGADWIYRAQVVQARAVSLGVEHFRSHRGRCMGTIWWQLNDFWPAVSWSVLDSERRRKLAWFALRRAYLPRLVTIQPRGDGLAAILVNDSATPWRTSVLAERLDEGGHPVPGARDEINVFIPSYDAREVRLAESVATSAQPRREAVRLRVGGSQQSSRTRPEAWWWFVPGAELRLPNPAAEVVIEPTDLGFSVEVRALTYLRDLCLIPDHLHPDATVDDNLHTLGAGDVVRFSVQLPPHADSDSARHEVLAGRALRCFGDGQRTFRIVTPLRASTLTGVQ